MASKIAIPTDDGAKINSHFGQASHFKVITVEGGKAGAGEMREKPNHQHGDHSHAAGVHPGAQMVALISDCQVLISGGMGMPAVQKAQAAGLKVILTRERSVDKAVADYLAGTLAHDEKLIHHH